LSPEPKKAGYSDTEILVLRKSNALDAGSDVRIALASEAGLEAKLPPEANTIPVPPKPSELHVANLGTVIGAAEIAQPVLRADEDATPVIAPPAPQVAMNMPPALSLRPQFDN